MKGLYVGREMHVFVNNAGSGSKGNRWSPQTIRIGETWFNYQN